MTAEEALELSKYQRPGLKLIVGPTLAREERVAPLSPYAQSLLPGHSSWLVRDIWKLSGITPGRIALAHGIAAMRAGHQVSAEEWRWLQNEASLVAARSWVEDILSAAQHEPPREAKRK